jgi:hypothetical protein
MAALLYKDFLIIAFGQFDKEAQRWMPFADISWHSVSGDESHTLKDSIHCFGTKQEAEACVARLGFATLLDERHLETFIQWLIAKIGADHLARAWTMPLLGKHKIAVRRPPFAAFLPSQLRLQSNAHRGESGSFPQAGF